MRKLIISWDTYSWVYDIGEEALKDPDNFTVMIICEDVKKKMRHCPNLCEDAIYTQRRYDLIQIRNRIGIKKVSNLLCDEDYVPWEWVTAEITKSIMFSGIKEIYTSKSNPGLEYMRQIAKTLNIKCFEFTEKEYDRKAELIALMTGE